MPAKLYKLQLDDAMVRVDELTKLGFTFVQSIEQAAAESRVGLGDLYDHTTNHTRQDSIFKPDE